MITFDAVDKTGAGGQTVVWFNDGFRGEVVTV